MNNNYCVKYGDKRKHNIDSNLKYFFIMKETYKINGYLFQRNKTIIILVSYVFSLFILYKILVLMQYHVHTIPME